MPVDTSFITNAGNPAIVGNPLTTATGYQNLANSVQQYQQNQQAYPLANALTQANIANTQQSTQNAQTTNTGMQLDQHQKRWTIQGQAALALANQPLDQITPDAVNTMVDRGVTNGDTSPAEAVQYKQDVAAAGGDPQKLQSLLIRHGQQILSGQQQLDNAQGDIAYQRQADGSMIPIRMPSKNQQFSNTGAVPTPAGTPLPTGLPPQIVPGFVAPDGSTYPKIVTTAPGVTSGAPGTPPAPFPGNVRPAAPAGATPPPGAATPPPATGQTAAEQPGSLGATSLPVGQAKSIEDAKLAASQAGITLTNTDADRPQKQALLTDIMTQANIPGAFTSPDAPAYKTLMARLSVIPGVISPDVLKATAGQEQMEKAMANYQTLQMKSMIGTNAGLAQTIAGSPHMELSKQGLAANVHTLQGSLDYEGAMSKAWQSSPMSADPSNFKAFQQDYIATHKDATGNPVQIDPRAFWMSHMAPAEAKTFYDSTNDKAQLARNYQYAITQGLIPKPGQ